MIFDCIISPSRKEFRYLRPLVSQPPLRIHEKFLFLLRPWLLVDFRVEVMQPTLSALFPNSSRQVLGNLTPTGCLILGNQSSNRLIFLQCPRTFDQIWLQHRIPPMKALNFRTVGHEGSYFLPASLSVLFYSSLQKPVLFFRPGSKLSIPALPPRLLSAIQTSRLCTLRLGPLLTLDLFCILIDVFFVSILVSVLVSIHVSVLIRFKTIITFPVSILKVHIQLLCNILNFFCIFILRVLTTAFTRHHGFVHGSSLPLRLLVKVCSFECSFLLCAPQSRTCSCACSAASSLHPAGQAVGQRRNSRDEFPALLSTWPAVSNCL
mmetsp:Transcript_7792/g.23553  ORF Transcript_7792/g.23553 Transcript_7792/m.23553 type:complete len:321 (-) Transcript_7792:134-1096(-)